MVAFPDLGATRLIQPGIKFQEATLHRGAMPMRVWYYQPEKAADKLALVLVPPAGSTLYRGMDLGDDDRREHYPYARAGFAVASFEIDGHVPNSETASEAALLQGAREFRDAQAGLANAKVALDFILAKVPYQQNPLRYEYRLTPKGLDLYPVLMTIVHWGDVHMAGPDGDMKAAKIELFLKPSGDELERLEAYDALTLREQNRTTTGLRMTFTTADEKYVVTGTPVTIVDQCERETTGKTLTFVKATDSIVVDGNKQIRTQTKGGGKCP